MALSFGTAAAYLESMPDDRLAVLAANTAHLLKETRPDRWNALVAVVDYLHTQKGPVDPEALACMQSLPIGLQAAIEIAVLATVD